jgi:hypothetical protein
MTLLFGSTRDFIKIDELPTEMGSSMDLGSHDIQVFLQVKSQD